LWLWFTNGTHELEQPIQTLMDKIGTHWEEFMQLISTFEVLPEDDQEVKDMYSRLHGWAATYERLRQELPPKLPRISGRNAYSSRKIQIAA
jgi:hypothetical protein